MGVHDQRPWRLPFQEKVTQDFPVPLAGTEEGDDRQPNENEKHQRDDKNK